MAYRFTMESVVNATMSCLTFFGNVNNFSMDYDGEGPVTARRELASWRRNSSTTFRHSVWKMSKLVKGQQTEILLHIRHTQMFIPNQAISV